MLRISEPWSDVACALGVCRNAAQGWARESLSTRLMVVKRSRHLLARRALAVAACVTRRPVRDTLVSEVLPLLDGMRFLERRATKVLSTKQLRRGKPLWLWGVSSEIRREPLGVVLILGPGNYPLFLPCIQAIQAIVAGNGVCLKPAPGGEAAAAEVARVLREAGLPSDVLCLLQAELGPAAVECKFDRIVLTGSADTGIKVLEATAKNLTPSTMELSGCDAAYVMAGADIQRAARCLVYGLNLNAGATCIAPRRVFVLEGVAAALEEALIPLLPAIPQAHVPQHTEKRLALLLEEAMTAGARIVRLAPGGPVVVANARCDMELLKQDLFAPWIALIPVADMATALEQTKRCPYALGATIFGPLKEAQVLATQVNAGSVCINDVIVPTADPRLPFGGSGRSGFGRTRGEEGLLEMTAAKSVSMRRGNLMPHLNSPDPKDEARFSALIRILHGYR